MLRPFPFPCAALNTAQKPEDAAMTMDKTFNAAEAEPRIAARVHASRSAKGLIDLPRG